MKLVKRTEIKKPDTVYNLHIQKDHNYIVDGAVVSNCHRAKGNVLRNMMSCTTEVKYKTGWTGTLSNNEVDGLLVKGLFGPEKQIITTKELMDKDIVAKLNIIVVKLTYPENLSKEIINLDYINQIKYAENCVYRTKKILKLVKTQDKTGLLFYSKIAHGEAIFDMARKMMPDRNVYLVHSGHFQKNDKKYKSFEDLKVEIENDTSGIVICNYQVAGTGISIRNLHFVCFASSVKSYITVLQAIGRGLRLNNNKNNVLLIDIVDDFSFKKRKTVTQNYALKHFYERFKIYNENQFNYKLMTVKMFEENKDVSENKNTIEEY